MGMSLRPNNVLIYVKRSYDLHVKKIKSKQLVVNIVFD